MNLTGPSHVNSPKIATKGTNSKFRRVPTKSNSRTLESTNRRTAFKQVDFPLAQPLLFSNLKKGLLNFPNPSVLKLFVSSKFTGVHLSGGNQIQPFRNFWRTVARNPSLPRTPKKRGGRKKKVEQEKRGWCDFLALKTKTDFFKKGIEAKKREHGKVKEVSSSSPHLGAWKMPLAILSPYKESCMVALEIPLKPNEINS